MASKLGDLIIDINVKIPLWDAIKLRIAGKYYAKYLKGQLQDIVGARMSYSADKIKDE